MIPCCSAGIEDPFGVAVLVAVGGTGVAVAVGSSVLTGVAVLVPLGVAVLVAVGV